MGLFDSSSEEPQAKRLRYIATAVAFVLISAFGIWFFLRFTPEKHVVEHFMDAVVAGDFQRGYQIWKPHGNYSYNDFVADWGLEGYYGPVKSYRIEAAHEPQNGGSGIIVVVEFSPFQPFPDDKDPKSGRNREVSIWVERSDMSLSFPP